nr:cation-transporting P-type ATPase [Xylocopilactobacillus apicola]
MQIQIDDFYKQLGTSNEGLSDKEAEKRLSKYGPNVITQGKQGSRVKDFLQHFISVMAILLWVSGLISMFAGMMELGIAIWAVNIINGLFSYWQARAAKKATDSLKKMLPSYAQVIRDNKKIQINVEDMVPGDVFQITAGNNISADARIISNDALEVDESALTGESNLVHKQVDYQHSYGRFGIKNEVFAGTIASAGSALAVATKTGMETELGHIAKLTQSNKKITSPLEIELNRLTRQISLIAIFIGLVFFVSAILFVHYPVAKSFIFALGMIVAFIPEGLLPTVTLSLAQGVQRMAKKHALVKSLNSVETLGETTVIASDKTGTLTQNQMTINHIWLLNKVYQVTGEGYLNNGEIQFKGSKVTTESDDDLMKLLKISALNSDTEIKRDDNQKPKIIGTPTEAAHSILVAKSGIDKNKILEEFPRIKELTFDSNRKRMTTIHHTKDGQILIAVKGALSSLLAKSTKIVDQGKIRDITADDKNIINEADDGYAAKGLRSLAMAYRIIPETMNSSEYTIENTENDLIFIGFTVMADPPRPEVYDAVKKAQKAGIKIIMVTGDSGLTAKSVAQKIGIVSDQARVITDTDLNQMSDDELSEAVKGEIIFARVAPEQKYRIVKANQRNGEIVASTGDGVNDAPALKQADIGIAMGMTGTDVAKDAADMILTDDNFASIVTAIEEGRTVYSNIQKFLVYILNSNLPEAIPSALFLFSRGLIPLPLTVMQILTVDLGTDMLPALGLGAEQSEPGIMEKPPRARNAHLLTKSIIWKAFGWYGLFASIVSTAAYFFINYLHGWPGVALASSGANYREATTMTLAAIVFAQIAAAINCRTQRSSVFKIGIFSNHRVVIGLIFEVLILLFLIYVPFFQGIFDTGPLKLVNWIFLIAIPIPLILVEELRKWIVRKMEATKNLK